MSTLLSKKTDYALLILGDLRDRVTGGSAREIADRYGLSKGFVANILKELCQKGFVVSHRGVKGGYVLQRPLAEMTLVDVLQSLEDGVHLTSCTNEQHTEHDCSVMNSCPIRGPINEIHQRVFSVLREVTLDELFKTRNSDTTFQPVLAMIDRRAEPELQEITA